MSLSYWVSRLLVQWQNIWQYWWYLHVIPGLALWVNFIDDTLKINGSKMYIWFKNHLTNMHTYIHSQIHAHILIGSGINLM